MTKLAPIFAMCVVLAACEAMLEPMQGQSFCSASHPIILTKQDKLTPATHEAVTANNKKGAEYCGWFGRPIAPVEQQQEQSFCGSAIPILYEKRDVISSATLRTIVGINETGLKLCGWKRP